MYIPSQEERYAKVAKVTLLLCVLLPPAVVAYLGDMGDVLDCAAGFLQPLAWVLDKLGFNADAALCLSATVQAILYWALAANKRLAAKKKLTLAICWGTLTALALRLLIAFTVWQATIERL